MTDFDKKLLVEVILINKWQMEQYSNLPEFLEKILLLCKWKSFPKFNNDNFNIIIYEILRESVELTCISLIELILSDINYLYNRLTYNEDSIDIKDILYKIILVLFKQDGFIVTGSILKCIDIVYRHINFQTSYDREAFIINISNINFYLANFINNIKH